MAAALVHSPLKSLTLRFRALESINRNKLCAKKAPCTIVHGAFFISIK
jgi:hypothetical protein